MTWMEKVVGKCCWEKKNCSQGTLHPVKIKGCGLIISSNTNKNANRKK